MIHGDLRGVHNYSRSFFIPLTSDRSDQSSVLVDSAGRARITDIGLAVVTRDLGSTQSASTNHDHDARWIAPEILDDRGSFSKEGDVFAFAGIAIEVRCR